MWEEKTDALLEPHNPVCPRFCLSREGQALVRPGGRRGEWPPPQNYTAQSLTPLSQPGPLHSGPRSLTVLQEVTSATQGDREPGGRGCCISPCWCRKERRAPPQKDSIWDMTETRDRDPGGCSSSSLPGAISPHLSSQDSRPSALLPPEPRVSVCKWDFVCLIFKRAP